jgi:hypothetical protein
MFLLDKVSNSSQVSCQTTESKWDKAICDAKAELAKTERRASRLRNALRIFQENKLKGVPWPTESSNLNGQATD